MMKTASIAKSAECVDPHSNELTIPKGEVSYNSFSFIPRIFLNVGGFLFVSNIGIRESDIIKDTKING